MEQASSENINAVFDELNESVIELWETIVVMFAMLLILGKSMHELGGLKAKSAQHVATKNICQIGTVVVVFYLCGFGICKDAKGGFYGSFAYSEWDSGFLFQFIACLYAVSIASTGLAERTFLGTHSFLAGTIACIIYPVVSAWSWGGGWLSGLGFIDFAGAGPIHVLGGTTGLIGTLYLKPRLGIFKHDEQHSGMGYYLKQTRDHNKHIKYLLEEFDKIHSELTKLGGGPVTNYQQKSREIIAKFKEILGLVTEIKDFKMKQSMQISKHNRSKRAKDRKKVKKKSPNNDNNQSFSIQQSNQNSSITQNTQKVSSQNASQSNVTDAIQQHEIKLGEINTKIDELLSKKYKHLKRLAPYFATFSDFELSVYIEYYEDALTEQHNANLILAVSGQVLACIGSLFFNSRYIATQSTIEEGISTFMANFVAGTCAALMIFVGQQLLRLMGNSDEISIYDPMNLLSCYMAGLVSISGCCNNVTFFSAAAIGCFGSVLFLVAKKLFIKIEIDDPINIVAVHLTCGIWALIAASLFDRDQGTLFTGNFQILFIQLAGIASIMIWCLLTILAYFAALNAVNIFRVGEVLEIVGLDYLEKSLNIPTYNVFLFEESKLKSLCRIQRIQSNQKLH